ncbi:MAG: hypothetical protein ACKO0Z_07115 [Betaproteobacteria bacterium]
MSDLVTIHTSDYNLSEEKTAHAKTKGDLDKALERNLLVMQALLAIKKSYWYRLGKFFRLVP